jgi:hypothetical protein
VINELGGGLWYSVLLEVTAGADAYERGASHAPHNRIKIVDGAYPDRQIDPIFHHISCEVRKNQIDLKAGIE